eukprot:1153861-Pelagomonas_calceolata.AAC.5
MAWHPPAWPQVHLILNFCKLQFLHHHFQGMLTSIACLARAQEVSQVGLLRVGASAFSTKLMRN